MQVSKFEFLEFRILEILNFHPCWHIKSFLFSDEERLKEYMKGLSKFKCQICAKEFASASNITNHMRIHTVEKPYECELCGARFKTKGNLKRHEMKHMMTYMW